MPYTSGEPQEGGKLGVGERKRAVHTQKSAGASRKKREKAENWVWEVGKELFTPKRQSLREGRAAKRQRIGCGR